MRRREFVLLVGGAASAMAWPVAAGAQQRRRLPVVGVLSPFNNDETTFLANLREGLRDYGYVEGKNLRIEYRSAEGRVELLPDLVS
ncbi:MAG: ABC transporter substrate-binding protein, partial [Xanthobacteraceae bacterium]